MCFFSAENAGNAVNDVFCGAALRLEDPGKSTEEEYKILSFQNKKKTEVLRK
jgi:hypothetical protein